ncbi:hypothetical protein PpBr36_08319 [Pyricularia pennisetigena]|uniref:hypothetical protein n=1 Tax=Pyricularia pennisetigena TaxID=1578925 RepID=UPI00114FEBCA|nr:hypothetical protein PpBr36_08319 [Pyricularia pennisetigena]TLS24643.1 hypothetical protein PpBr36_08319 [Pyricularia pennisetigena]
MQLGPIIAFTAAVGHLAVPVVAVNPDYCQISVFYKDARTSKTLKHRKFVVPPATVPVLVGSGSTQVGVNQDCKKAGRIVTPAGYSIETEGMFMQGNPTREQIEYRVQQLNAQLSRYYE